MRHWSALTVATVLWVAVPAVHAQEGPTATSSPIASPTALPEELDASPPGVHESAATTLRQAPEIRLPGALAPRRHAAPSVGSLISELPFDFRAAASTDNAIIMLSASASASLMHPYDQRITARLTSSPSLDTFFAPGKLAGGFAVQFGGAWAAYGLGRVVGNERLAMVGADLVRAQIVNSVFTQGLKLSVGRSRPDGDAWSFPSGHTSGTFANAAVLHRHFGWKVGAPMYALATYVAASRIQERRHFASDVLFGAGVGLISGRAVTVGRGRARFAAAPMGLPGGAGITFTRID